MQTPEEFLGELVTAYETARRPPTSLYTVEVDHGVVAVLDLIRERDAEVAEKARAEAWSEGFRAGRRADHNQMWWPRNPYREREGGAS